jgi:anti-sigma factor RsiW
MTENVDMGVNAYLDGELGPEEAAEIEAQLDVDPEARAQFDAFFLQKAQLGEAADALDAKSWNLETARLERRLATAIERRSTSRKVFALGLGAAWDLNLLRPARSWRLVGGVMPHGHHRRLACLNTWPKQWGPI